jgi:hypothetical protein
MIAVSYQMSQTDLAMLTIAGRQVSMHKVKRVNILAIKQKERKE